MTMTFAALDELRQGVRALRRTPGTALLAVLTLGFGIAAATTTFSAVYAALLRPLPFEAPDRLLFLHTTRQTARDGTVLARWSPAKADAIRRAARSFEGDRRSTRAPPWASAATATRHRWTPKSISTGYFETLGVPPALGRAFTAAEEAPGHAVALLGDRHLAAAIRRRSERRRPGADDQRRPPHHCRRDAGRFLRRRAARPRCGSRPAWRPSSPIVNTSRRRNTS